MSEPRIPDPALVVLVGASASGKSTWASARYRSAEIVSSDALRGIAGSGPHDLDASVDAFALLEQMVEARASPEPPGYPPWQSPSPLMPRSAGAATPSATYPSRRPPWPASCAGRGGSSRS